MELFKASNQWKERPADERFGNVQEMYDACKGYADSAVEAPAKYDDLRVESDNGEIKLVGKENKPALLTNWAFGQLSQLVQAPAGYLRELPGTLAAQNLNYGLKHSRLMMSNDASLLFHQNGSLLCRAITSTQYKRIWNWEIVKRLLALESQGWRVPPARPAHLGQAGSRPATEADVLNAQMSGIGIHVGDMIAPAGLYASDHDMFAFLVNEKYAVNDGTDQGMARGFFAENSEVGGGCFRLTTFLYRWVCGNHIVWGAEKVREISLVHRGNANKICWDLMDLQVRKYAEGSVSDLEAKISTARRFQIAMKKEDVLDRLFGLKIGGRKILEQSYAMAEENESVDGAPNTAWGFAQGMTRLSQKSIYADKRVEMDRAAGKVLQIAF